MILSIIFRLPIFAASLVIFFYLLFAANSYAAGPMGIQYGAPIEHKTKEVKLTDAVADQLAQSGAGWVRVNFIVSPFGSDNDEFYAKYDGIIDRLRSRGLQVVGLMSNESWPGSQQEWIANNAEKSNGDGYNSYIDKYGYAFARMAKRWEGKIKYWEIWNEPNAWQRNPDEDPTNPGGSYIYPSNFAALLTHAYSQARHYNKIDVKIISGGVFGHDISGFGTGPAGVDYVNDTYNVGINRTGKFAWSKATFGTYPLDFVGQHIYINQWPDNGYLNEAEFLGYLDNMQNAVAKWEGNSNKKTFITEIGWATNSGHVTEGQQAYNLEKSYKFMKDKNFVQSAMWFKLEDDPPANLYFGLYRPDGSKKQSYNNFKTAATYQGLKKDGSAVKKIRDYYNSKGSIKAFGSPSDNGGSAWAHWWDYGYVQDFDGGNFGKLAIFDTGYRVQLGFWRKYLEESNHTKLKFPKSDEFPFNGGVRQNFQGGYMTWDPVNDVRVF